MILEKKIITNTEKRFAQVLVTEKKISRGIYIKIMISIVIR